MILAYSRETKFFYAYYVVKTLASMAGEGSFHCLALAYVVFLMSPSQTKINSSQGQEEFLKRSSIYFTFLFKQVIDSLSTYRQWMLASEINDDNIILAMAQQFNVWHFDVMSIGRQGSRWETNIRIWDTCWCWISIIRWWNISSSFPIHCLDISGSIFLSVMVPTSIIVINYTLYLFSNVYNLV